ncbi:macro domain-containing protein [Candidatus Parcubacteria bacterium]|nr:macro domain-containing protein [Candidatus Parcubacteria bacterium]
MAILTVEIIKQAAEQKGFNLRDKAFAPRDLGLKANRYGAFSDYCNNTKSSKHNKREILTAVEFNKGGRPTKYKLLKINIITIQSDITTVKADAIVNPANVTLLGGGGCDGMIHKAAGAELLDECKKLGGCEKSEAKITKGYNLPAKFIIHTVGPVFRHENGKEKEILTSCYINSFKLAKKHGIKTIVFPCISTGCFHFPKDEAAKIAISVAKKYINNFEKIIFVCFLELDHKIYKKMLGKPDDNTLMRNGRT